MQEVRERKYLAGRSVCGGRIVKMCDDFMIVTRESCSFGGRAAFSLLFTVPACEENAGNALFVSVWLWLAADYFPEKGRSRQPFRDAGRL